jgi:hypothetical protein
MTSLDAAGRVGIVSPLISYFSPAHTFVLGAVKGHVACEDDVWVERIHSEHPKADTVGIGAAVSSSKASRWDLNPICSAVHGLIEVMVRVAGPQKRKRGVNDAQSIAGILEDTMYERPGGPGVVLLNVPSSSVM